LSKPLVVLGGNAVERDDVARIFKADQRALFIDLRQELEATMARQERPSIFRLKISPRPTFRTMIATFASI
jgi:hypothetical protein